MRGQAGDLANIAAKKQRIMEAGFQLFSERGIESVTMKTIAEQSGVPWNKHVSLFRSEIGFGHRHWRIEMVFGCLSGSVSEPR